MSTDNTVVVSDDNDATKVTLSAPVDVDENATSVTYTVTADRAPEAGSPLTVTVQVVGEATPRTLTITNPDTTATFDVAVRGDDFYDQGNANIVANITSATGGNFEAITVVSTDNTVVISDDNDATTANITVNITDSVTATISVQLSNPPQNVDGTTAIVYVQPDNSDTLIAVAVDANGYGQVSVTGIDQFIDATDGSLTVSYHSIAGGNYENVVGTIGTDYLPEIAVPAIGVNAAITADASLDSSATGSLDIDYGTDGAAAVDPIVITYTGGLGDATTASESGTTTITADDYTWVLTIDEATGDYTFDQTGTYTHADGADSDSGYVTVTIKDADGDTTSTQLQLTITDDVPTVAVQDVIAHREVGITTGTITFDSGADSVSITDFIQKDGTLTWVGMDTDKYIFDVKATTGTSMTYAATYVDANTVTQTYFEVTVKNDGTYDFNLLEPAPSIVTSSGELFGDISAPIDTDDDGKADTAIIDSSNFNGAFSVAITGSDDGVNYGGDVVISKSATDIGVDGNSLQESQDESMRFTINREAGYSNTTLDTLTINASVTGNFAFGSNVSLIVTYTNGTYETISLSAPQAVAGMHTLVFDIDSTKLVDYVDLAPADNNLTMKIVGVSMDYTERVDPSDNLLQFTLTGEDADGDAATASFNVNLIAGTSGNDTITSRDGADNVSGGDGDDVIVYDALDTIDGGAGTDTLKLDGDLVLNFSDANINNMEIINLGTGNQNISLSMQDVLDMTDSSNKLTITDEQAHSLIIENKGDIDSDGRDEVSITNNGWTESNTDDTNYTDGKEYSNGNGDSITLTIDEATYDIV